MNKEKMSKALYGNVGAGCLICNIRETTHDLKIIVDSQVYGKALVSITIFDYR